mgnify:CR=1 FL=1
MLAVGWCFILRSILHLEGWSPITNYFISMAHVKLTIKMLNIIGFTCFKASNRSRSTRTLLAALAKPGGTMLCDLQITIIKNQTNQMLVIPQRPNKGAIQRCSLTSSAVALLVG